MKKLAWLWLVLLLIPTPVKASSPKIVTISDAATLNFPESMLFTAEFDAPDGISEVRLHYGSLQDTCGNVTGIAFPEFTAGKKVKAEWEWNMLQSGGEPPGASIWWRWELTDAAGNITLTDIQQVTWLDDSHNWQSLAQGNIRLHYYAGGTSFAETLTTTAVDALRRLEIETGIPSEKPVDLYIYGETQDMLDAVLYEPGWTGGLAYPEYNIVIIGIPPEQLEWGKRTEAHELTHVLVGDFTFSCLGAMPTWLVEGLAVYGEGSPDRAEATVFENNKNGDTLLSFQVLSGGFSEDPDKADLSYSQSYYMVNYLVEKYGKDRLIDLLTSLKTGEELNAALTTVYGFDLAGFENEWRAFYGLPAKAAVVEDLNTQPTPIPTIIPLEAHVPGATITPAPATLQAAAATPIQDGTSGTTDLQPGTGGPALGTMIIAAAACLGLLLVISIIIILVLMKKKKSRAQPGGEA